MTKVVANVRILQCVPTPRYPESWVVRIEEPGKDVEVLCEKDGSPFPDKDTAVSVAVNQAKELQKNFPDVELWNKEEPGEKSPI